MENKAHLITDRQNGVLFVKKSWMSKPYIDAERALLATQAYKENQNQPRVMVRALCWKKIFENMMIYIEDKSLSIAGNQATEECQCSDFSLNTQ